MSIKTKPKALTFVFQNTRNSTINTLQWKSQKRTVDEAWEEAMQFLLVRAGAAPFVDVFNNPFERVMTLDGLVTVKDESAPLRKPTRDEIKKLEVVQ